MRAWLRPALAVGAGWLVPGLGHVMVGRLGRGLVFGLLVWCSFGLGLAHDGRLALRDERQPFLTTMQVVANLGVGPADVIARLSVYGEAAYRVPLGTRLETADRLDEIFRERSRSALSIYGTAYLWTAGLMNLLLLFDVWDIGRGRKA
ncbi:MAG TPA: DUF6677 family protein [Candidatus Polarisedimenticolaceae bacterium]|nr:DUF6677 family protein [Candidatus Polarisedimenticolaceae bacterium]